MKMLKSILIDSLIVSVALALLCACSQEQSQPKGSLEKITVGAGQSAVLVYVAKDQGYFTKYGLDVAIKDYQAGKLATDALMAGEVDISTASDSAFVSNSFAYDDLRTFGVIATNQTMELVARKDHGINQIQDLKGKKVGVTKKSSGEFSLGRLLSFHGLSIQEIKIVDLKPKAIVQSIQSSQIDAAVTWQPHVYTIKGKLGDNAISWSADQDQDAYFLLITKNEWISSHPSSIKNFLKALVQAEKFVKSNPAEAKESIRTRYSLETEYLQSVWWPKYQFFIQIPQELILTMEDQARWRIANKLTDKTNIPNYLDHIYLDGLDAVKSEAITIIR